MFFSKPEKLSYEVLNGHRRYITGSLSLFHPPPHTHTHARTHARKHAHTQRQTERHRHRETETERVESV